MSNHNALIDISAIHEHTQNPIIKYEIGGYFIKKGNTLEFYVTSVGNTQTTKRMFVDLPTQGMIWHTHPPNAGFWPSFEDINRHNSKHILFSKYGVWIFDNNPLKNNKNKVNQMNEMKKRYREFHTELEEITQRNKGWNPGLVETLIQIFIGIMKKRFGFKIEFIPNWFPNKKVPKNVPKNTNIIKRF